MSPDRTHPAETTPHTDPVDVLLISMPFGPLKLPSIGLGLLKASLPPLGISGKCLYLGIDFAREIGPTTHTDITGHPEQCLIGEWIFAGALFGEDARLEARFIDEVLRDGVRSYRDWPSIDEHMIETLVKARRRAPSFIAACAAKVLAYRPRIVGFTSVFQQHVASLALAKRLKQLSPETTILFGGANCEGPMGNELVRQFGFVDAVLSGEGDRVFPDLVTRILNREPVDDLPGVYTPATSRTKGPYPNAPAVRDMDALPIPDYDDFFEQWLPLEREYPQYEAQLPFETSRGCWWGEKHHCTFCGLNGIDMIFRRKSAERALDELRYLVKKYPGCAVMTVDNILDMKYLKDFIPQLAREGLDLELFYEVKSNLKKEQIRLLRDAGIRTIQAGVESLSTPVLDLMRKGVSALQNVQTLKWSKELGVKSFWNILWGFPGEAPEEYERVARLLPWLFHLRPPHYAGPVRLDRFSPYFEEASSFGFTEVTPYLAYSLVYPFDPAAVKNIAYYFTARFPGSVPPKTYTAAVDAQIAEWRSVHAESDLFSTDDGKTLQIFDTRPAAQRPLTELSGLERALYEACDGIRSITRLQDVAQNECEKELAAQDIEAVLKPLVDSGLMLREGGKYLSLAIPVGTYTPNKKVLARFLAVTLAQPAHAVAAGS